MYSTERRRKRKHKGLGRPKTKKSSEPTSPNLPAVVDIPLEPCDYEINKYQAYLWARDAWFRERETAVDIAEIINVPMHKVNQWIHGQGGKEGWKAAKARFSENLFKRFRQDEKEKVTNLLHKMLEVLGNSAEYILSTNQKLNVTEFNTFCNAFEKLFKTRQLLLGQATDILGVGEYKDVSWANIVQRIKAVDILDYDGVKAIAVEKAEARGDELIDRRET